MRLDKVGRMAMLLDFYGPLLTPKQQDMMRLYYEQDLSYGEIAAAQAVSRQAVADNLKRAERSLERYEEKMGLLAVYLRQQGDESTD
jgi:predicted DNA-binding protein YlxM (UPF0122 family)